LGSGLGLYWAYLTYSLSYWKQKQTNKLVHCIGGHSKKDQGTNTAVDLLKERLGVGVTFGLEG
jgi:hypothetical protein